MITNSVKEASLANQRVNLVLLEHLTKDMLECETPAGGYTVAQHLAHMVEVTKFWGSRVDSSLEALADLYYDFNDVTFDFKAELDLKKIKAVMLETLERSLKAAEEVSSMAASPHPTADAFLIHMLVHDAHHRGQILLALKANAKTLPNEDALWGPWRGE